MWKKVWALFSGMIIIDIILWYLFFYSTDYEYSAEGLLIFLYVVYFAGGSLFIGLVSLFWKKSLGISFLFNSAIIVFLWMFIANLDYYQKSKKKYQEWEFKVDGKNYRIIRCIYEPKDSLTRSFTPFNSFQIFEFGPGWSSTNYNLKGTVCERTDTLIFFRTDSLKFSIVGDYIMDYKGIEKIKVSKKFNTRRQVIYPDDK